MEPMTSERVSEFSVPRTTVEGLLLLAQGQSHRGTIFLIPRVSLHSGSETPLDMLNRPEPVFPFVRDHDSEVLLVAKAQTVCLSVERSAEVTGPEAVGMIRSVAVEVTLADGTVLEGQATLEMPESRARLLDYLNAAPEPFFAIATDDVTHYINRNQVLYVRPRE